MRYVRRAEYAKLGAPARKAAAQAGRGSIKSAVRTLNNAAVEAKRKGLRKDALILTRSAAFALKVADEGGPRRRGGKAGAPPGRKFRRR